MSDDQAPSRNLRPRRVHGPETRARAFEMLDRGHSQVATAKALDVDRTTLRQWLKVRAPTTTPDTCGVDVVLPDGTMISGPAAAVVMVLDGVASRRKR